MLVNCTFSQLHRITLFFTSCHFDRYPFILLIRNIYDFVNTYLFSWIDSNYKPENMMSFFTEQIKRQEQICDTTSTTPYAMTSENHPNSYLPNSDCRYCVKSKSLGNYVKMELDLLKLDARRNCYPAKDYILIENWDGSPISSPVCTIIRRNPIKAMSKNAICIKFVTNNKVRSITSPANGRYPPPLHVRG